MKPRLSKRVSNIVVGSAIIVAAAALVFWYRGWRRDD